MENVIIFIEVVPPFERMLFYFFFFPSRNKRIPCRLNIITQDKFDPVFLNGTFDRGMYQMCIKQYSSFCPLVAEIKLSIMGKNVFKFM